MKTAVGKTTGGSNPSPSAIKTYVGGVMVQVKKEEVVSYTLQLTQTEAQWLQGIMQNPLHGQTPDCEEALDKEMRMKFWQAFQPIRPSKAYAEDFDLTTPEGGVLLSRTT